MKNDFFVLMNDFKNPYQPTHINGLLDIIKGDKLPICSSKISFPYDVKEIINDEIYWNFNKNEELDCDYYHDQGHIISEELYLLINEYNLAPNYKKNLRVWMAGKQSDYKFNYFAFDRGTWEKGVQKNKDRIFYDVEKSKYKIGKRKEIIPTGSIVLTENANKYDCFELSGRVYGLSILIIISKRLKEDIEEKNFKGIKIIPLNEAFEEYCTDYKVSLESLLPKVKKNLP
ncbi:Imm43 family immunity protein [Marinomonas sp. 2405UD68-3]|uniref:Imm43 family immunity protein n=1 Tax=Marinomonas sp. 2405UD68-3 TaxID=3391835 RepID=UPI0039C97505